MNFNSTSALAPSHTDDARSGKTLASYPHVLSGLSFSWAKSGAGNSATDESFAVGVDSQGNVYTAGWFENTISFASGSELTSKGAHDIFISKRDSDGNLVWVKQIGGDINSRDESVYGLQVDSAGNIYTTGYFQDTVNFGGTVLTAGRTEYNVFVAKFDPNGNTIWAKKLGGSNLDVGHRLTLDSDRNVYTTGYFGGTADFDPGTGTANLSSAGGNDLFTDADVFVSKLDANGNFVWVRGFGNIGIDRGNGIITDSTGNVYTTGQFSGTVDFDPGVGTANLSSLGNTDVFISKLDSSGNFLWAKGFGGREEDSGTSVISDRLGNVYVSGLFRNTLDFGANTSIAPLVSNGEQDAFLAKFDSNGNLLWAKSFGGSGNDIAYDLKLDSAGNIYLTGNFSNSVNFNPGGKSFTLNSRGDSDIFLAKFDDNGNFLWAGQMGGSGNDLSYRLNLDAANNVYTTGHFSSTANFDPTQKSGANTANLVSQEGYDIFVAKLVNSSAPAAPPKNAFAIVFLLIAAGIIAIAILYQFAYNKVAKIKS